MSPDKQSATVALLSTIAFISCILVADNKGRADKQPQVSTNVSVHTGHIAKVYWRLHCHGCTCNNERGVRQRKHACKHMIGKDSSGLMMGCVTVTYSTHKCCIQLTVKLLVTGSHASTIPENHLSSPSHLHTVTPIATFLVQASPVVCR